MQKKFFALCLLASVSVMSVRAGESIFKDTKFEIYGDDYRKSEKREVTIEDGFEYLSRRVNDLDEKLDEAKHVIDAKPVRSTIDCVAGAGLCAAFAQWATHTAIPQSNLFTLIKPALGVSDTLLRAVPGVGFVYNGVAKLGSSAVAKVAGIKYGAIVSNLCTAHAGYILLGGFALKTLGDGFAKGADGFKEHHKNRAPITFASLLPFTVSSKQPEKPKQEEGEIPAEKDGDTASPKIEIKESSPSSSASSASSSGTQVQLSEIKPVDPKAKKEAVDSKWKLVSGLTYGCALASHNVGLACKFGRDVAPYLVLTMALNYALAHQKGAVASLPLAK